MPDGLTPLTVPVCTLLSWDGANPEEANMIPGAIAEPAKFGDSAASLEGLIGGTHPIRRVTGSQSGRQHEGEKGKSRVRSAAGSLSRRNHRGTTPRTDVQVCESRGGRCTLGRVICNVR